MTASFNVICQLQCHIIKKKINKLQGLFINKIIKINNRIIISSQVKKIQIKKPRGFEF